VKRVGRAQVPDDSGAAIEAQVCKKSASPAPSTPGRTQEAFREHWHKAPCRRVAPLLVGPQVAVHSEANVLRADSAQEVPIKRRAVEELCWTQVCLRDAAMEVSTY
jgi:hypothetical protein